MRNLPSIRLPRPLRATIIRPRVKYATFMALTLLAHGALAQPPAAPGQKGDDLDVTMQIIVDPDAKLPDEVVRRIPLPERKSAAPSRPNARQPANAGAEGKATPGQPDKPGKPEKPEKPDNSSAREAREAGREAGQAARERAKEAAEAREEARRAERERRERERDDNRGPPQDPPGRPPGPPGRP